MEWALLPRALCHVQHEGCIWLFIARIRRGTNEKALFMTIWLLSNPASLPVIDGLLAYQTTGNALPMLIALGAPFLRLIAKGRHHA